MCGRYALHGPYVSQDPDWSDGWHSLLPSALGELARYNIAPTQQLPVVVVEDGAPLVRSLRWGLIPHWARGGKPAYATFNARAEGLVEKPSYRDAWRAGQRCLVPVSGWYEWRVLPDGRKQACYLHAGGVNNPLMLAGLWAVWQGPGGAAIRSYTIITTRAVGSVAEVHDRQPRVLVTRDWRPWLSASVAEARHWLEAESVPVRWHAVSAEVGKVRHDHPGLIAPLPAQDDDPGTRSLW